MTSNEKKLQEKYESLDPEAHSRTAIDPSTGCWEWQGSISQAGYGNISRNRRTNVTHRYVYELLVGKIPEGLVLDHTCNNRRCCNPSHLQPVTRSENSSRSHGAQAHLNRASLPAQERTKSYLTRMPPELYESAKAVASANSISFNSLVNQALEATVQSFSTPPPSQLSLTSSGFVQVGSFTSPTLGPVNVLVTEGSNLSDVIAQLSTGESHGEEAEEPEAG